MAVHVAPALSQYTYLVGTLLLFIIVCKAAPETIPAPHNERNCIGCIDLLGDLASAHDGRNCLHLRFKAPSAVAACVRDMRDANWA